jgi:hypothetical protein
MFACGPAAQPANGGAVTASPPAPVAGTGPDGPPAASGPNLSDWVDAGGGLSLRLELPAGPYHMGDRLAARLHFRNDGATPLRVYLIGGEAFRAQQSDFQLFAADGRVLDRQPDLHPHGYVVTEADFPEIGPNTTTVVEQTLDLSPGVLDGQAGTLRLRWRYANSIAAWKGGAQTLDGPTRSLFGGGPIPGIWRGQATVELGLPLAP